MTKHRIYAMSFAKVYPHYITKAEKKGRTKAEVDTIIFWLTGHHENSLKKQLEDNVNCETFFTQAPQLNPKRKLITGSICGVKIDEIDEPIMKEIRYLDKLVDELATGKSMKKILRE